MKFHLINKYTNPKFLKLAGHQIIKALIESTWTSQCFQMNLFLKAQKKGDSIKFYLKIRHMWKVNSSEMKMKKCWQAS